MIHFWRKFQKSETFVITHKSEFFTKPSAAVCFSGSGGLGYTYERTAEKDSKYLYKNLEQ